MAHHTHLWTPGHHSGTAPGDGHSYTRTASGGDSLLPRQPTEGGGRRTMTGMTGVVPVIDNGEIKLIASR